MKAFFVGLIFLMLVVVMSGLAIFLYPFLFMLGIVLRMVLGVLLVIFAIWLLGKMIIYVWELLRPRKDPACIDTTAEVQDDT